MKTLLKLSVAFAALTMAGPAQAADGPAFNIYFHTDETLSQVVGFAGAACIPDPIATMRWGYSTPHQEIVFIGECIGGVLYYIEAGSRGGAVRSLA